MAASRHGTRGLETLMSGDISRGGYVAYAGVGILLCGDDLVAAGHEHHLARAEGYGGYAVLCP